GRGADVIAKLGELGVRNIREAAPPRTGPLADGLRAAHAGGIRATLGSGDTESDPAQWLADSVSVLGDGIDAVEAPNELDSRGDPSWPAKLRTYMPALAAAARKQAPGAVVIGPSFIDPASRAQLPADLPGLFNGHPYSGGDPPEPTLALALDDWHATAARRQAEFTETGYHNALAATAGQPPASEQAAADYLPRLLVTAFGAGVRRTFIYELLDEHPDPGLTEPEWHFGLLRNDFSPKPAFTAIQTLIAAVRRSPGPSAGSVAWSLHTDGDDPIEHVELGRSDGSLAIALWRPVSVWDRDARKALDPGTVPVQLSFEGFGARDVEVWRPSRSAQPVMRRDRVRDLPLELQGDLVLVSLR
ncbi:MAG: hypothetical protein QOK00_3428, partial [Thermoleophilaceae bacterium]|nr:hypothetical protein [Thermoleophilaceae bacterium]